MSDRTKATSIPPEVKLVVGERDGHRCIMCGRYDPSANEGRAEWSCAHYIPRSHDGMGIEQNIVTLCPACHCAQHSYKGSETLAVMRTHLEKFYPGFKDEERRHDKWKGYVYDSSNCERHQRE